MADLSPFDSGLGQEKTEPAPQLCSIPLKEIMELLVATSSVLVAPPVSGVRECWVMSMLCKASVGQ